MNHPSEWQKIYHPRIGRYVFRHKGTGVVTDSLFSIGRNLKKPILKFVKKTGKKVAEETGEKIARKAVKKAGDKIGEILRKNPKKASSNEGKRGALTRREEMMRLNNLLSSL